MPLFISIIKNSEIYINSNVKFLLLERTYISIVLKSLK